MKKIILKQLIRALGMIIVGISVMLMREIGLWYLIPWLIGWFVYDLNKMMFTNEK